MRNTMSHSACLVMGTCLILQSIPLSTAHTAGDFFASSASHENPIIIPNHRLDDVHSFLNHDAYSQFADSEALGAVEGPEYARFVIERTRALLPEKYKAQAAHIAQVLIDEANLHQMDPVFLMALISHESGFNPETIGSHGEVGLMQIKPSTARSITRASTAKSVSLDRYRELLANPYFNIRCGARYLSQLRVSFRNRHSLYLSAYNMGPHHLRQRLQENISPRQYSDKVLAKYFEFAMDFMNSRKASKKSQVALM
jgi:soluble lytic murein transglycosylase-like protein